MRLGQALRNTPLPVLALIVGLILPVELSFNLGLMRLAPHRVVLLVCFLPAFLKLISGRGIRVRACDVLFVLYNAWSVMVYMLHLGPGKGLEFGGALALESLGSYVVVRAYVRNYESFRAVTGTLFLALLLVGSIAAVEAVSGVHFVHDWLRQVTGYYHPVSGEKRLGLLRAYSTFDHPILYGCFCASILSLMWLTHDKTSHRVMKSGAVAGFTFFGLSSAPLLTLMVQSAFITWEKLTRRHKDRVKILLALLVIGYVIIDLISTRPAYEAILMRVTLDPWTAFYRIQIWTFGIANIMEHPMWGIGQGDWERLRWMASSTVDAFWLVIPMRIGLPSITLLLAAIAMLLVGVHKRRHRYRRDAAAERAAIAWTISFLALALVGLTVHYWNAMHAYFFFMLGLAGWLLDPVRERQPSHRPISPPALALQGHRAALRPA